MTLFENFQANLTVSLLVEMQAMKPPLQVISLQQLIWSRRVTFLNLCCTVCSAVVAKLGSLPSFLFLFWCFLMDEVL